MNPRTSDDLTPVEALQKALAGEHAAVYLFGILGAHVSKSRQPTLFGELDSTYAGHRAARDELTVLVSAQGEEPVAAEVSYELPGKVGSSEEITATALIVERRMTLLYGELVGHTAGSQRSWAIGQLDRSALRELRFGARPSTFPGLT